MRKFFHNIILSFFISFFMLGTAGASGVKVENVFGDIDENYKYLEEVQSLYDQGILQPDSQGRLNPYGLLTREEFVGIVSEVSCQNCIKPNVDFNLIEKYANTKPFYDLTQESKYFYCVADALDKRIVSGYHKGSECENGVSRENQVPFCPYNAIILEEALAVLMRASNILSNTEAQKIRNDIAAGRITQSLSEDVHPKNSDGSVYSFYPDFQKALDYEVLEYDSKGNQKIYKLIEVTDGKLRPKKSITKEDFFKIAAVALKANSCRSIEDDSLALEIDVFDKQCQEGQNNCRESNLDDRNNIYDFSANALGVCDAGVEEPQGYIWRFYNENNSDEIKKYGKYLDDFQVPYGGNWRVYLRVIDRCGNTTEIYHSLLVISEMTLGINAQNYPGSDSYRVDFAAVVDGGKGPYQYSWDFGDGSSARGELTSHNYEKDGVYTVKLVAVDSNGLAQEVHTTVIVKLGDGNLTGNQENTSMELDISKQSSIKDGEYEVNLEGIVEGGEGPYQYNWNFGDGSRGSGRLVDHKYKQEGTYVIELEITDSQGRKVTKQTTVEVKYSQTEGENMQLSINKDLTITNGEYNLSLEGVVTGGEGPYTYNWDFGDGNTGNGRRVNNIYTQDGLYLVELEVTDSQGKKVYATTSLTVVGSKDNVNKDLEVILNSQGEISGSQYNLSLEGVATGGEGPYTYNWDFGDGNTGVGPFVDHSYNENGVYTINLEVVDANGDTVQVDASVSVNLFDVSGMSVSIDATPIYGPIALTSIFKGEIVGGKGPYQYQWTFSDGTIAYGNNLSHVFTDPGNYTVMLQVSDSQGNNAFSQLSIQVVGGDTQVGDLTSDWDNDGVVDGLDSCPLLAGDENNQGCPILEEKCGTNADCDEGFYCDSSGSIGVCKPKKIAQGCLYTGGDALFGNVVCNTCPCTNSIDYLSSLRKCDIVFPAITSPDGSEFYSQGQYVEIKK